MRTRRVDFDNFTRKTYWISTILPVGAQNLPNQTLYFDTVFSLMDICLNKYAVR